MTKKESIYPEFFYDMLFLLLGVFYLKRKNRKEPRILIKINVSFSESISSHEFVSFRYYL